MTPRASARRVALARCLAFGGAVGLGCSLVRPLDELESSSRSVGASSLADCGERARGESELSCSDAGASCPACPPEMQQVLFPDGTAFCIDRYETSRGEYDEFLADVASCNAPPSADLCSKDSDFVPGSGDQCSQPYLPGVSPNLPITCVDLCDAKAYCEWRGKRLCGAKGREIGGDQAVDDPNRDEWFAACTGGGDRSYPYGDEYSPSACNTDSSGVQDGRSFSACATPDPIFNLSGNVAEWQLLCGYWQLFCRVRGGAFSSRDAALTRCAAGAASIDDNLPISARMPQLGFRCCRDSAG